MDRRPDRLCYNRPCVRGDQKVVGPSHVSDLVDPVRPEPPVSHVCEAVEAHRTHDGRDHAALWNPCRGWEHGATLAHATAEPRGEDALVHGDGLFQPRQGDVVTKACALPFQDPGGRGGLPEDLPTVVAGIGTPARGPTPIRVRGGGGFRRRLQRVERDRVPCPILHGRHGERALRAVFLRHGAPLQRSGAIATPLPSARDGGGVFLWGVPEVVLHPGRLCARLLRDACDGEGARGNRVHHQRAQALALAPCPCRHCLDAPPLQGPSLTMTRRPVDRVPGPGRQARGRVSFHADPWYPAPRCAVCLVVVVRSHPQDVSRRAASGPACPPLHSMTAWHALPPASRTGSALSLACARATLGTSAWHCPRARGRLTTVRAFHPPVG